MRACPGLRGTVLGLTSWLVGAGRVGSEPALPVAGGSEVESSLRQRLRQGGGEARIIRIPSRAIRVITKPNHPELERYSELHSPELDPKACDAAAIDTALKKHFAPKHKRTKAKSPKGMG